MITRDDLFRAWKIFQRGKMEKQDVLDFTQRAEEHIHGLCNEIEKGTYRHGTYQTFRIRDPKLRTISKACVRDRILHQAVFTKLEPVFDHGFIFDSYSSRKGKGMLAMLERFENLARQLSCDNRRAVWVMKCDVRKFFDSVDHEILKRELARKCGSELMDVISNILESFSTRPGKGIPLGNITSQIFSNVYLNPLDQYMKRRIGVHGYMRYADDIVILADKKEMLVAYLETMKVFLRRRLGLELHPDKVSIRTWRQGVDILGYISYPKFREIRTVTKRRIRHMLRAKSWLVREGVLEPESFNDTVASYRGRIKHAWSRNLAEFLNLC